MENKEIEFTLYALKQRQYHQAVTINFQVCQQLRTEMIFLGNGACGKRNDLCCFQCYIGLSLAKPFVVGLSCFRIKYICGKKKKKKKKKKNVRHIWVC